MAKRDRVSMDRDELVREHEHLVDVLRSPSHKDDAEEADRQEEELEEYRKPGKLKKAWQNGPSSSPARVTVGASDTRGGSDMTTSLDMLKAISTVKQHMSHSKTGKQFQVKEHTTTARPSKVKMVNGFQKLTAAQGGHVEPTTPKEAIDNHQRVGQKFNEDVQAGKYKGAPDEHLENYAPSIAADRGLKRQGVKLTYNRATNRNEFHKDGKLIAHAEAEPGGKVTHVDGDGDPADAAIAAFRKHVTNPGGDPDKFAQKQFKLEDQLNKHGVEVEANEKGHWTYTKGGKVVAKHDDRNRDMAKSLTAPTLLAQATALFGGNATARREASQALEAQGFTIARDGAIDEISLQKGGQVVGRFGLFGGQVIEKALTAEAALVAYHNAAIAHPAVEGEVLAPAFVQARDDMRRFGIEVMKSLHGTARYTRNGVAIAHHDADAAIDAATPAFSAVATPLLKKSLDQMPQMTREAGGPSDTSYGPLAKGFLAGEALAKAQELSKGGVTSFVYYGGGAFHVCVDQPPQLRHHEGRGYIELRKGMTPQTHFTDVEGRAQRIDYDPRHLGIGV